MSKYPTGYAYEIGVCEGVYKVYKISKYSSSPSKYTTEEEAQIECDRLKQKDLIDLIENRIRTEFIKYNGTEVDFVKTAAIKIVNNLKTVL